MDHVLLIFTSHPLSLLVRLDLFQRKILVVPHAPTICPKVELQMVHEAPKRRAKNSGDGSAMVASIAMESQVWHQLRKASGARNMAVDVWGKVPVASVANSLRPQLP